MTTRIFDPDTTLGRDYLAVDWAGHRLGEPDTWNQTLANMVRLMLSSRFAMWMAWGPELTFFCNDAYREGTLGAKYPWALGRPAYEVWAEIWDDVGPLVESVMRTGVATWDEDLQLFLERSGYLEETYHTFSYSPIFDDDSAIPGMLCVVSEETARVVGNRRMTTARDLGTALATASTTAEVGAAVARELGADVHNLPFAIGYVLDDEPGGATLAFSSGAAPGDRIAPLRLTTSSELPWTLDAGFSSRTVDLRDADLGPLPAGIWPEQPTRAVQVPFVRPGHTEPLGFLVAGLNPYRELDEEYLGFLELVAGQIAAALIRAGVYEDERRRAEDLAELDRAKTTFFTNVSHELRTPLTLLLGPAADALEDTDDPLAPSQRARIEVIARNAARLHKLVNTLLDFSRVQAGRLEARFAPVELDRYTAELVAMFDSAMLRAGLSLHVETEPGLQPVYVDSEMWAKVVLNLLSNALKATFAGGVTVRLHRVDDAVELTVTDTGIGIAEHEQRRLFERFHRVSHARLRSHEGSGIGLALVAELVGLHGGQVQVRSEVGVGSTFMVRVPLGSGHLPGHQLSTGPDDDVPPVQTLSAGYLAEAARWLDPTHVQASEPARGGRPHLLVVDDNADMRDYIVGLLRADYDLTTAADGVEALARAAVRIPDLVLSDVMMPRLDGFGLLAALREDPALLHVPVVLLSARSGDDAVVVGLESGADDYLIKPFSARELKARVRSNLELDRARRVAEELSRSRALLDQAEELAHVGSWEIDLDAGSIVTSAEFLRIVGIAPDARVESLDVALASMHPEDRDALSAALAHTQRTGHGLDLELKLRAGGPAEAEPGGAQFADVDPAAPPRLVRVRGRLYRDAEGAPRFIRGSAQDLTDQREAELAVRDATAAREAAAREHAIADELQRSMLPTRAVQSAHAHVAAYYAAGVEGTQAGGDWYDVIELDDNRTALVIGDVMGRGVRAAAVMGQLRAMVRAYSRLSLEPQKLLALLDDVVADFSESTIVTCVYVVHDAAAHTLTYANAGHMPPLLLSGDGPGRRLSTGDPPLGTRAFAGRVETVLWTTGSRLVLYTDGLVERRGADIDTGIDTVTDLLGSTRLPVEGVPNMLVSTLLEDEPNDDIAILVMDDRGDGPAPVSMTVQAATSGIAPLRDFAARTLQNWDAGAETVSDALLVISELATNSVRHGVPPIDFRMRVTGERVVVEVSDSQPAMPRPRQMNPLSTNGRGLHIVEALSEVWGTRPTGAGKTLWCVLPLRRGAA